MTTNLCKRVCKTCVGCWGSALEEAWRKQDFANLCPVLKKRDKSSGDCFGLYSDTDIACNSICLIRSVCKKASLKSKNVSSPVERGDGIPSWCPMETEHIVLAKREMVLA